MRLTGLILSILVLLFVLPQISYAQTSHPFMIVRQEDYPSLRQRANQEPYASMKADAISDCQSLEYIPDELSSYDKGYRLQNIVSACSLAFILDQANSNLYKRKILDTFSVAWPDILAIQRSPNYSAAFFMAPAAAFLDSVLAMDIIYNSLTSSEKAAAENLLSQEYNHYYNAPPVNPPTFEATQLIWNIYQGKGANDPYIQVLIKGGQRSDYRPIDGYKPQMDKLFTSDGVYYEGPFYGTTAFAHQRIERSHIIDILEFTGIIRGIDFNDDGNPDNYSFYQDPKYKNLYEWLFGYASSPSGLQLAFGDSSDFYPIWSENFGYYTIHTAHTGQASRFSQLAGQYAFWRRNLFLDKPEKDPIFLPGRLLHYLFLPYPMPATKAPVSRIFNDGGAFFIEANANKNSLYGALWNVKITDDYQGDPNTVYFHAHKDTNSIYISGYGEPLLLNVGFKGASTSQGADECLGFSTNYMTHRAVGNNVALINYSIGSQTNPSPTNDHRYKFGAGISEGFVNPSLDYASGDSGLALANGRHIRNFIFVHPKDSDSGYFVLIDEIESLTQTGTAHISLHPNSDLTAAVKANEEYRAPIPVTPRTCYDPNTQSPFPCNVYFNNQTAGLDIYLATPPQKVDILDGVLCHWEYYDDHAPYVGKYLFSTYPITNSKKNIVTILFPFDQNHNLPSMQRLSGSGYTGARINFASNSQDVLIESDSSRVLQIDGVSFQARAAIYRQKNNANVFYYVKNATSFRHSPSGVGFESNQPVTLFLEGRRGSIISQGVDLSLYYPNLKEVKLNGSPISLNFIEGGARVSVPDGTYELELVSDSSSSSPTQTQTPTPIPGDANSDGRVDGIDYVIWLNHYDQETSGGNSSGDFNNDGRVDGIDYVIWLRNYS